MSRVKERRRKRESLPDYFERLQEEKHQAQRESLPRAWGDWLSELGKEWRWDWFGTFTIRDPKTTPEAAHHFVRRYLDIAGQVGIAKPFAFRIDEYCPTSGRLHLHALVGNTSHLHLACGEFLPPDQWGRPCCWTHRWPCGYARILPYDPTKGAAYYVTKYVDRPSSDWELIGFD